MCNELANCTNFSEPKHSKTALQFVYSDFIQNSEIHREMVEWINFQNKFARAVCTVLQYGLWSFQTGYIKLERFLHKNQHTQRNFLNFENWTNVHVNNYEFIINFLHNSHNLTWYSAIVHKFNRNYPVCSTQGGEHQKSVWQSVSA